MKLRDEERRALDVATRFARGTDLSSSAEAAYLDVLPDARREITCRLVRGLLRGRPGPLPEPEWRGRGVPDGGTVRGTEPSAAGDIAALPLSGAGTLLAPVSARHGFDRHRLDGAWLDEGDDVREIDHPDELRQPLVRAGVTDEEQAATLVAELRESVANLALARLADAALGRDIEGTRPVLDAVAAGIDAADDVAPFERLVTDGHPCHYAGKIRRGMAASDGLAYAAEFTDRISLRFAAIRRTRARSLSAADAAPLTELLYDAIDGLRSSVARTVSDPSAYAVVPVHPWQFHNTLPDRYRDDIDVGRVVPLDHTVPATPLLNVRTVVPYGDDPPHLKLPVAIQITNAERTLSPQATTSAPRVTDLLADRLPIDGLDFLAEPASTSYYPPDGPHTDGDAFDDVRHLGAVARRNPRTHPLTEGQVVPAAALAACVPGTDRSLIAHLVDERGGDAAAARAFIDAYAGTVVPPHLALQVRHGVALESHLQNTCIVIDDEPVAALVRDSGGIRVLEERLDGNVEFYPDSDQHATDRTELYRKLYYALFQNHLGELIATLATQTPADEADLWSVVRTHAEQGFDGLRDEFPERVARDERVLFADRMEHKALTAMRLAGKRTEYVTSEVSNPLAGG